MVNRILLRKTGRDLRSRKGSLIALILIVMVGVGLYIGMASVYLDLDGSRDRYYNNYQLADFSVDLKRAPQWAIAEMAKLENVDSVRGRVNIGVLIDLPGKEEPISGTAISMPEKRSPVLNDLLLRSGTWFSGRSDKEVILNDAFATANGLYPGCRIKTLLLDKQHDLLVVGTAMSPEFVYLMPPGGGLAPDPERFGVLYLPEDFLQKSCDLDGAYNQLIGKAYDASRPALDRTLTLIENELDAYGVTNTTPIQEQPSARFLSDELTGLKVSSTIMPTIFLGVAALVLNILLGRMIALQRTIIGTLKALGYSRGAIIRHYLGYGLAIGTAGGIAGVLFGLWLQRFYVGIYRQFYALPSIDAHFYPDILLTGVAISVGFALLGTLQGVRQAAGLEPAVAMRPPPPEKGGRVLPERIGFFWRPLPFRWKMIFRGVFRNPFRSAVSLLASGISTALIVAALSMVDSLNYLMSYEFEKVAHQDLTVSIRDPKGEGMMTEARMLPAISEAEPQLSVVCDLSNGPFSKRVGVMGLPSGNRLYTPLDNQGKPVAIPDAGIILTRKLAEILSVSVGDRIELRPLIGLRRRVRAPVAGIVESFLGLGAYSNMTYLSTLIGEQWSANMLLCDTFTLQTDGQLMKSLQERPDIVGIGRRTRSLEQMNETFGKTMGMMISILVLFAGLIAFGSVLNTALVSLSERQRDVGTFRVLGYTPSQVSQVFSGESILLNGLGIIAGLGGGYGLAYLMSMAYNTELYRFPTIIYPSRLALSAFLMAVFVGLAQLIIYRMIRKLPWLEVLKVKE